MILKSRRSHASGHCAPPGFCAAYSQFRPHVRSPCACLASTSASRPSRARQPLAQLCVVLLAGRGSDMGGKPTKKTRPPVVRAERPARQPAGPHPRLLAEKLYSLHAKDNRDAAYLESWPGDAELYKVLVFGQEHTSRLKSQ